MNAATLLRAIQRLSVAMLLLGVLAVAAVAALLWWSFQPREEEGAAPPATELAVPRGTRSVTLFFGAPSGDSLIAEPRQIVETEKVTETVSSLITELARGPAQPGSIAVMPKQVAVRHVFLDEAGEVYVDVSPDLVRGFRGGSSSEYLLLTALVRTLSFNLPTVSSVTLTVEGRPLASLGGHFALEGPLRVAEWR
jgi:spore germination protein GerM